MIERSVLFPAPLGPNTIVTPGGASTSRSIENEPPGSECRATTDKVPSGGIGASSQLDHAVEQPHRDEREDDHHDERVLLPACLERVVDPERRRLRLSRDVTRDHERDAEV